MYNGVNKKLKIIKKVKCTNCNKDDSECVICSNKKFIDKIVFIDLKISKNTKINQKIIIKNMGDESYKWDIPGDIIFVIKLLPHKRMKRINNDLFIIIDVLLIEALTGINLNLDFIDNTTLHFSLNSIITSNNIITIKNKGFFINNNQRGNLLLKFNIIYPKILNDVQKEKLKNILPIRKSEIKTYELNINDINNKNT